MSASNFIIKLNEFKDNLKLLTPQQKLSPENIAKLEALTKNACLKIRQDKDPQNLSALETMAVSDDLDARICTLPT